METINNRIAKVVEESGLKKVEFARRINVSQSHVSRLVSGETAPSDRTISDICRVCGINEVWLRTGVGEPHADRTREEEIATFEHVLAGNPDKAKLIRAIINIPDDDFLVLVNLLERLHQILGAK